MADLGMIHLSLYAAQHGGNHPAKLRQLSPENYLKYIAADR
jgi:hypothetical protein